MAGTPGGAKNSLPPGEGAPVGTLGRRRGTPKGFEPFMIMSFLSLPVIPHLKLTTKGLVNVDTQSEVPLAAE